MLTTTQPSCLTRCVISIKKGGSFPSINSQIDTVIDIADIAGGTEMPMKVWEGILIPGFPVQATTIHIVTRFSQDYPIYYRPAGWRQKWDALLTQTYEQKRNYW